LNFSNKNREVLEQALFNLANISGWRTIWQESKEEIEEFDGKLRLERGGKVVELKANVKSLLHEGQIPQLLKYRDKDKKFLIIAGRISRKLMEELKALGIHYLESGGNAWIDVDDLFLLIEGKKGGVTQQRRHLFTNASIKLLFHLLIKPELFKLTYREIAEQTGASLDNISKTIRSLRENGYLAASQESGYVFSDKEELVKRWIPEYGERLKPKLSMGNYRFLRENRWENIILETTKTRWGGEPAADKLLNLLRPEIFTLYTREQKQELIKKYRLVPDPEGPVKIYHAFWDPAQFNGKDTVPELLIYTDLLLSGSARNAEVAKKLLDAKKEIIL
jgi:hypothetical protein